MIKALKKRGFWIRAVVGSHYIMTDGTHTTSVPYHNYELSRDLLMEIIRQSGQTTDEIRPHL